MVHRYFLVETEKSLDYTPLSSPRKEFGLQAKFIVKINICLLLDQVLFDHLQKESENQNIFWGFKDKSK